MTRFCNVYVFCVCYGCEFVCECRVIVIVGICSVCMVCV